MQEASGKLYKMHFFEVWIYYPNAFHSDIFSLQEAQASMSAGNVLGMWNIEFLLSCMVFSTTGGRGREAATFYKRLSDMISQR